jgi:hypothetical protein
VTADAGSSCRFLARRIRIWQGISRKCVCCELIVREKAANCRLRATKFGGSVSECKPLITRSSRMVAPCSKALTSSSLSGNSIRHIHYGTPRDGNLQNGRADAPRNRPVTASSNPRRRPRPGIRILPRTEPAAAGRRTQKKSNRPTVDGADRKSGAAGPSQACEPGPQAGRPGSRNQQGKGGNETKQTDEMRRRKQTRCKPASQSLG